MILYAYIHSFNFMVESLSAPGHLLMKIDKDGFMNLYGKTAFALYLQENQIEVQSTKTTQTGQERHFSHRELSTLWWTICDQLFSSQTLDIVQVMRTYRDPTTSLHLKREMYFNLRRECLERLPSLSDVNVEALKLGIAFLFDDTLELEKSLIHVFETQEQTREILDKKQA